MYSLIFDTTARNCSIALLKDGKMVDGFNKELDFGHAEILVPEIRNILKKNKLAFDKLSMLAVCIGPGSFTGVRTSIAAARGFGLASKGLKVLGVSTFEAYMESLDLADLSEVNAVIVETKRDDFYYQLFDADKNKITPPSAGTREEILGHLKSAKKITFVGDGVERFLAQPEGLPVNAVKTFTGVPIEALAACALFKYKNKILSNPNPLYLRSADVNMKSCS
jgi:tRNA threonylcarbamoyladenosine biosynthesis protein TsaB